MPKYLPKIYAIISLVFFILFLYQMWHLCQYGGVTRHILPLLITLTGCLLSLIFLIISWRRRQKTGMPPIKLRQAFRFEIIGTVIAVLVFGGFVSNSAIPYNGALSWKLDALRHEKKIILTNTNFFAGGVDGILADLDRALTLPDELYLTGRFSLTMDGQGEIRSFDTFLYGKDNSGTVRTYLISYDSSHNTKMTVWTDGTAKADFNADLLLDPMTEILKSSDCQQKIAEWERNRAGAIYEILYYGRRSFTQESGLQYLPGDVDQDGLDSGIWAPGQLDGGGEITGYEVSLHLPAAPELPPVRYIMEPAYTAQAALNAEHESRQIEAAKAEPAWIIDDNDGTMYFFLDDKLGWRFVVADAMLGKRFYVMEKTADGGGTWTKNNADPFLGNIGVTDGLIFYDASLGFAGLTGASRTDSQIYVTRDGGLNFTPISLPLAEVTELPPSAKAYGYTVDDFVYMEMPEPDGSRFTVKLKTEAGTGDWIAFESDDDGDTWRYIGVSAAE